MPDAAAAASSGPRRLASLDASSDSGMNAISPATPCTPRRSLPPSTSPMPMPVPTCTKAKLSRSRPYPWVCSASAAASTSFSSATDDPNASRRPASAAGRSQPASPPVSAIAFRFGS